ncbi:hypothetical protein FRC01_003924 [Tulasnella sp. 417]|nr:hypothetical protein FRC01_003924 [Tulasnella sp. 417]
MLPRPPLPRHPRDDDLTLADESTTSPGTNTLKGILIKDPVQSFVKGKEPLHKPVMKTPGPQPSDLLTTPSIAPTVSFYPTQARSSSSTVTGLSIKPPPSIASGISASSQVETELSILNSQFGTSTSGSMARSPSSAGLSPHTTRVRRLDRQNTVAFQSETKLLQNLQTFVVNRDPDSSDSDSEESLDVLRPSPQPAYHSNSGPVVPSLDEESVPVEWISPLPLTLEELFEGGTYALRVKTRFFSGELGIRELNIDVKPGWMTGTRIIFPNAGNERSPGAFHTIILVVKQVDHERFTRREGGNLLYNADIDPVDAVKENGRREVRKVLSLDGKIIEFYPSKGVINPGQEMRS